MGDKLCYHMITTVDLRESPAVAADHTKLRKIIAGKLHIKERDISEFRIIRRSIDARGQQIKINLTVQVAVLPDMSLKPEYEIRNFMPVKEEAPVMVIVGAGPAGLFAALKCIENGIRPIVLERGKDVDQRRHDLAKISREKRINPDSNYCYGEGGAGAFSDGKLYTRSKKRGNNREVLELLVQFGASENILSDAHPHIGSDKLPGIIKHIRETIIKCGGEVRFSCKAERLVLDNDKAIGVELNDGSIIKGAVMLANGHSARDFIRNLHAQNVGMEAKGFAIGVRLEHPQALIDSIQYHTPEGRGEFLPAAEYSFVTQADGRGVYSFCMCPGGVIVPAGSAEGELVVNGMSASARSGKWANSGMVVEIRPGDFPEYEGAGELQLLEMQEELEKRVYNMAGSSIIAPAQRMKDFIDGRLSKDLPSSSYAPGIQSADFSEVLPQFISSRLKKGFEEFGRKRKGFISNNAILLGLESRTSSPVRLPRDKETLEHVDIENLYPVGEGAGYAGGIVSAAIDGMNAAAAHAVKIKNNK